MKRAPALLWLAAAFVLGWVAHAAARRPDPALQAALDSVVVEAAATDSALDRLDAANDRLRDSLQRVSQRTRRVAQTTAVTVMERLDTLLVTTTDSAAVLEAKAAFAAHLEADRAHDEAMEQRVDSAYAYAAQLRGLLVAVTRQRDRVMVIAQRAIKAGKAPRWSIGPAFGYVCTQVGNTAGCGTGVGVVLTFRVF